MARPAFAEEVKASDTNAKTEVVAPAIENVVATVETKTLDENPTATTTDAPTGTSIINSEATSVTTDTTAIPETAKPASEASSTVISETMIEKPHSFSTACNVATQIIAQVASHNMEGKVLHFLT